ncbi:MAG: L,D-transpeptidase family protein [Pseudomonadota bacterium]
MKKSALAICAVSAVLLLPRGEATATDMYLTEDNDMIGQVEQHIATHADTLEDIARNHSMGFVELMAANPGVDPWLPGKGTPITLPSAYLLPDAPRRGIVVNLPEMRLYHFRKDGTVGTYPVGIGREAWETPELITKIVRMRKDPTWVPPASIRKEKPYLPASVGPGPDNPLGAYAMSLSAGAYVIHGTNKPTGVGRRVSSGCIRLYPEDIENLFGYAGNGVPVRIVSQEVKVGWYNGDLYVEAHPSEKLADRIEAGEIIDHPVDLTNMLLHVQQYPGAEDANIDWVILEKTLRERRGIPIRVSLGRRASVD